MLRPLLVVFMVVGGLLVAAPSVRAVHECGGVQDTCSCGAANFCICCSNSTYGTDHGNCVWFAWHKACCVWSIALQWCTDASTWDSYAQNNGYPVRQSDPCADTIFQCEVNTSQCGSGGYGHVGWVETTYPDGSIDVTEQGCYSWYGVVNRHINAQSASPPMNYIYAPGTSCGTCECNPGDTEQQGCTQCGTQTRTCGSDCQWGGWSSCQNQGPCSPGDTEQQSCTHCGTETRTCGSDCQWGSWSACQNQGDCNPGDTQGCGQCGGTQTCESNCSWGTCVETCPDASVPADASPGADASSGVDASPGGDASPGVDGAPGSDATLPPTPDAAAPTPDGGDPGVDGALMRSGCQCRAGAPASGGMPLSPLLSLLALLALLGLRWRRRGVAGQATRRRPDQGESSPVQYR
jgi:MYXO-CTERM domain-containing protein